MVSEYGHGPQNSCIYSQNLLVLGILTLANAIPIWMQLQDILEGQVKRLILVASGPLAFVKCGIMKYPSPG